MERFVVGDILVFTKDLGGTLSVHRGDRLRYLGDSSARILDGPSKDWLVWLEITAPVAIAETP